MAELIVALDLDSVDEALRIADALPGLRWAKVGPMLFLRNGPSLVNSLKQRGIRVFLDLKWHDIPNSVAGAARAASELGVDLATVHALGGREMIEAARDACGEMKLVAVTVLTSHSPAQYWDIIGQTPAGGITYEATRLASMAVGAGAHGVVSSPLEVRALREAVPPDMWIVVPGLRPCGTVAGDQQRTAEPRAAVEAGATHLVIGRPITRAEYPAQVYDSIREEIEVGR